MAGNGDFSFTQIDDETRGARSHLSYQNTPNGSPKGKNKP
jgi:hypothetical protein